MQIDLHSDIACANPRSTSGEFARSERSSHSSGSFTSSLAPTGWLWPSLIIAAFLIAAHGWALRDGLFLDDHLHVLRYADHDWSWQGLLNAATVKPDEFIHSWWQERIIEWHYTRSFSILLGKIVYQVSGHSVPALHALSLLLHFACSLMVFALARKVTRNTNWSIVAGLLFVVYSHSVYAVGWLAAQNSVLQTCLTLAALLAYVKTSGLDLYAAPKEANSEPTQPASGQSLSYPWLALSIGLWILALLSRETAIVLPVILVAFDLAFGGKRQIRQRMSAYFAFATVGVAFAIWRLSLAYHPIPDFYLRRYDGPAYIFWYLVKLLHWITSAIWLSPMTIGPTARLSPVSEVPWDCVLMLAIVAIMFTGYVLACRRAKGWWIWPLWILLTFLPVVPVMAGPQSGYMAGVGFALAMVLGPALRDQLQPVSIGRWSKPIAIWFLIATCIYIPIYRSMWGSMNATERFTLAGVKADPPPPPATDLFFINLPFVNVYAQLEVRETLNSPQRPINVYALTYAPNLLRVEYPTVIEQLDAHSFRVRMQDGRPYFSGALGRYLVESMRPKGRFQPGEKIAGEVFDTEVTQADAEGVRELTFRFHRPLTDPAYCFYVSTNQYGAARVRFWSNEGEHSALTKGGKPATAGSKPTLDEVNNATHELEAGHSEVAERLFTAALSDDKSIRELGQATLRRIAAPVVRALAAPMQDLLSQGSWTDADVTRLQAWWSRHIDEDNFRAIWTGQKASAAFVWDRDRLFRIREITSHIIKTDLYMTGPPFPSPR